MKIDKQRGKYKNENNGFTWNDMASSVNEKD